MNDNDALEAACPAPVVTSTSLAAQPDQSAGTSPATVSSPQTTSAADVSLSPADSTTLESTPPNPSTPSTTPTTSDLGHVPELQARTCGDDESVGDSTVTCWTLVVPVDRTHPDGPSVELPVVRAPATGGAPSPIPTVFVAPLVAAACRASPQQPSSRERSMRVDGG